MFFIGRLDRHPYREKSDKYCDYIQETVGCLGKNTDAAGYKGYYKLENYQSEYDYKSKPGSPSSSRKHALIPIVYFSEAAAIV
jgi:hypothetical protein